jgi:hypothetical protein
MRHDIDPNGTRNALNAFTLPRARHVGFYMLFEAKRAVYPRMKGLSQCSTILETLDIRLNAYQAKTKEIDEDPLDSDR